MRRAFTVVELLVVIAIVGILASLLVGAIGKFSVGHTTRTEEVFGPVTRLQYVAAKAQWEGVIDSRHHFYVKAADADCLSLVAQVRKVRLKAAQIQGIIQYEGNVAPRGRLLSVMSNDIANGTVTEIDVDSRDEDAVRELMQ